MAETPNKSGIVPQWLIQTMVMSVLFFTGMAYQKAMDPKTAYIIAGCIGAVAFALAIVRYKQRKAAGE